MGDYILVCGSLIWYAVTFSLLYHLLNETKEKRYPEKIWIYLLGGMGCTAFMVSLFYVRILPVRIVLYTSVCSLYSQLLYRCKDNRKVPYGVLHAVITMILLFVLQRGLKRTFLATFYEEMYAKKLIVPTKTTFIVVIVILIYRVFMLVWDMIRRRRISFFEILSATAIMGYSICCLNLACKMQCDVQEYEHNEVELLLFLLGLVLINIYFLSYTSYMQHSNELQVRLKQQKEEEKLTKNYYEHMELNYSECKRILHDVKNHMQVLEAIYQAGDHKVATEYANTLSEDIERFYPKEYSSNRMINVILYDKLTETEKYGIEVQLAIEDVTLVYMELFDIATIFCNIFDNAIRCLKQMPKEERRLVFKVRKVDGFDVIYMENPMDEESRIAFEKKVFFKKVYAGTGLKNVRRVVSKYHGDYTFEVVDNHFRVSIYFCA